MPQKRPLSPHPVHSPTNIYRSSQILDRSSRFIALYSPSLTARDLQSLAEVSSATHRIAAWRSPSSQSTLSSSQRPYVTSHDDDGEKYGGKALGSVLSTLNVEGAVIVARWYGGILLGPVRFDHIQNCARDAIGKYISATQQQQSKKAKSVADDDTKRNHLIRILPERDQSISVLRGLLVEKQSHHTPSPKAEVQKSSPIKVPNYSDLPLSALENLERARDATIGWILGQIEKVEAQLEAPSNGSKPVVIEDPPEKPSEGATKTVSTVLDAPSTPSEPTISNLDSPFNNSTKPAADPKPESE
ncbi:MAG: hypothetical protein Q9182_004233 [Xanthomendoza sp. 2 TL-2023]